MITADRVIPLLLEACPSFRPAWDAHQQEWEGESPGLYVDAGVIGRCIVEAERRGDYNAVSAAFRAIERVLAEGDTEADGVAVIGLLESVQNLAGPEPSARSFERYLGQRTRQAWDELNSFWQGDGASSPP